MLGPALESQPKPSSIPDAAIERARADDADFDLIERAAADGAAPAAFLRSKGYGLPEEPVAAPARVTTKSLHIDLERLRKMNMITPDAGRTPIGESFRRVKRHILANLASAEPGVSA